MTANTTIPGTPPPTDLSDRGPAWHEDLADGAPGIAMLHAHYAATGKASWNNALRWLTVMGRRPQLTTDDASLFRGVPGIAFALRVALAAGIPERGPLDVWIRTADATVDAITRQRLSDATARLNHDTTPPPPQDWNLADGLTGIAAGLLIRDNPDDPLLRAVLTYLVQLVTDYAHHPDWTTPRTPQPIPEQPDLCGRGIWGMRHGIAGTLALLTHATDQAITVTGQREAIDRLATLYEPHFLHHHTSDSARVAGRLDGVAFTPRPSWDDGTAGIARALQLTAIVLGDTTRRQLAESVLASCLADEQARSITDHTVCHGRAGLHHILRLAAADADPASPLAAMAPHTDRAPQLRICDTLGGDVGDGLLTGRAGIKLTILTAATPAPPHPDTSPDTDTSPGVGGSARTPLTPPRWDDCLLIHRRATHTGIA